MCKINVQKKNENSISINLFRFINKNLQKLSVLKNDALKNLSTHVEI